MANLLSRGPKPFPTFDQEQCVRFEERARFLVGRPVGDLIASISAIESDLEADLEELDASPSLAAAQSLASRIDDQRRRVLGTARDVTTREETSAFAPGEDNWIGYRPARSLETGEAEIASRGFFDARDRPPLGLWVDVVARARVEGSVAVDLAVICYVPSEMAERARAGREICSSGALTALSELSPELDEEVRRLLG